MKEKELTKKELLAQEVGMKFDEVAPIFSEETLSTMTMAHVVGGTDDTYNGCTVNPGCTYPGCIVNNAGDDCKTTDKSKTSCSTETNVGVNCNGDNCTTKGGSNTCNTPTVKPTEKPGSLV